MSYLETKRNALMNAIASGQLTNLFANATWNNGFFDTGGGISGQTSNKEKYTDTYIEVDTTKRYLFVFEYASNYYFWNRFCGYNQEKVFARAGNIGTPANISGIIVSQFVDPYIRFSCRTYGNLKIGMYDIDEVIDYFNNTNTHLVQE